MNNATNDNFRYTGMGIDPLSPREDWWNLVKADGYTIGEKFFWTDEKGVKYTADRKLLYKAPKGLDGDYTVLSGTLVICDNAFAFTDDVRLNKIVLPEGLKAVGEFSLSGCVGPVELPSSVEYIGDNALSPLQKRFVFPKSLKHITHLGIPLEAEEFISESPYVRVRDGMIIFNDTLLRYFGKKVHVVIPNDVTTIAVNAFSYCDTIESVVIPDSVKKISQQAFSNCVSLRDISILGTPKIGVNAFYKCPGYKE